MMQTTELSPTTALLRDAAALIVTGAPVPPTARQRIADWLTSWQDVDVAEDGPMPEDLTFALRIARAVLGPEGTQ